MKGLLLKFFGKHSAMDQAFRKESIIDVKVPLSKLIQEIKHGDLQQFIETVNTQETVPLLALRKLTIVHNLLIHNPKFCQSFEEINTVVITKDKWLNESVFHPYSMFLYKIINSGGFYAQCKFKGAVDISFKMMFYVINTLLDLFPCVNKMSSLYRYYNQTQKQLKTETTLDYVMTIAYEAQQLYNRFKAILIEMISSPDAYLKTEADRKMIKYVLEDILVKINEEMKNLFLDKYYFPYGKGIGVKLFREEELIGSQRDFVDCLSMIEMKKKKPKKMTLDKFLFDQSGRLNPEAYMTLSHIRQGDMSYREGGFQSELCRGSSTQIRDEIAQEI